MRLSFLLTLACFSAILLGPLGRQPALSQSLSLDYLADYAEGEDLYADDYDPDSYFGGYGWVYEAKGHLELTPGVTVNNVDFGTVAGSASWASRITGGNFKVYRRIHFKLNGSHEIATLDTMPWRWYGREGEDFDEDWNLYSYVEEGIIAEAHTIHVQLNAQYTLRIEFAQASDETYNYQQVGTPNLLASLTLSYNPVGQSASVTIPVDLGGCAPESHALTFQFRAQDGSNFLPLVHYDATTQTYSMQEVPRQAYTLHIKGARWLAKNVVADTSQGDIVLPGVTLLGGDANDDNACDIYDLAILARDFNSDPSDERWHDGRADFNCDGSVDIFDLAILAETFNTDGDP